MEPVADLTRRLVACDTTSAKSNVPAIELLADRLESSGFRTRVQAWEADGVAKSNLVAAAGPAEPGGLIVCGHTDTVPWERQPGWTRDPLALEIGDDRVYGRGSSDMKSFIAQAVVAGGAIDRSALRRPLILVFTADEEVGCLGAARLAPELARLLGEIPLPTLCWIGEPTSWEVFHAHKSFAAFDVVVRGRGGHSGLPELGLNAIGAAASVLAEIGRYQSELRANPSPAYRDIFPRAPHATLNIGTIAGGAAANMIADECTIRLSTRALPDADPLEPYRELARRLAAIDARDPAAPAYRAEISLGEPLVVPGVLAPRGTELEAA
ncbi:MAG TPA: M20/M25/M40 family metallo-hydrolase, partial [Candidatus Binatia bacterium]|nr:M20/M25/M40 family metallo-hydrolase [Candidatus Binatia bacterium]